MRRISERGRWAIGLFLVVIAISAPHGLLLALSLGAVLAVAAAADAWFLARSRK